MELLEERVNNAGHLDSIGVDMTLRTIYQSGYGIFNHHEYQASNEKHVGALKLVGFHAKEDLVNMNRRQNFKRRFADSGVAKYFNISYSEFLQYPTFECDDMINISRECSKRDNAVLANLNKDMVPK